MRYLAITLSMAAPLAAQAVPHPAEHLGHAVGEDFRLVDWDQTSSYYQALASASPRVELVEAPVVARVPVSVAAEVIADKAAWVRARHGEGTLHPFGLRPQSRSWSQAAFHLLFRATLFGDV